MAPKVRPGSSHWAFYRDRPKRSLVSPPGVVPFLSTREPLGRGLAALFGRAQLHTQPSSFGERIGADANDERDPNIQTASAAVITVAKRSPLSLLISQEPSANEQEHADDAAREEP
jgi:hypothetical protein